MLNIASANPRLTAPVIPICVPDPLSLLQVPAHHKGGRNMEHPQYRVLEGYTYDRQPKDPAWFHTSVVSAHDGCKVTFHKKTMSFSFLSLKGRRTQSGEGPNEYLNAIEMEVDPYRVDYQLHGLRIHYEDESGPRFYTLDCVSVTSSGEVVADEVKASASFFAEPFYATHVLGAQRALKEVNITFRKVTGDNLRSAKRRTHNVGRAFANRFTAFSEAQCDRVQNALASSRDGSVPMRKIEELLKCDPGAERSTVNAMMCARQLAYDLNGLVHDETEVLPAPVTAHSLPDIRAIKR